MEAKYYTPKIEDLHHNFECEVFFENKWNSCIIQNHEGDFCVMKGFPNKLVKFLITEKTIEDKNIRVKHLDREDIESLGWEFVNSVFGDYCLDDKYFLSYSGGFVEIGYDKGFQTWKKICLGVPCRNKSELQKLMHQLEILNK